MIYFKAIQDKPRYLAIVFIIFLKKDHFLHIARKARATLCRRFDMNAYVKVDITFNIYVYVLKSGN